MVKTILLYIVVFTFVGATSFFLHEWFLGEEYDELKVLLKKAYVFHGIFSLSIIIVFRLVAKIKSVFPQLGFIYMGLLVFKIMVFTMMFYPQLMGDQIISRFYRGSILIPIAIFLILEVVFVTKILRGK
ncbi:DUF6168 family protein [Euzebyella marina]|uniref:DUF6168 family protein n=1 Tax=Euzebyella marina TaxID=1761453 RepID=UPI0013CE49FB|nr:DUF6168 family protein [Euzebyella marina]